MTTIYKIRHKFNGLFSRGGSRPRWSKDGKIWNKRSTISSHLVLVEYHNFGFVDNPYEHAEIVEYEIREYLIHEIPGWTSGILERREERQQKRIEAYDRHQKEVRRQEFLRLKEEFSDEV